MVATRALLVASWLPTLFIWSWRPYRLLLGMHEDLRPIWLSVIASRSNNASVAHYVDYPDGRVVSAFFLGCVFSSGLQHLTRSSFIQDVLRKVGTFLKSPHLPGRSNSHDMESLFVTSGKAGWGDEGETQSFLRQKRNSSALVFTLNLSLILASLAMLLSILNYAGFNGSEVLCAFVIAWGGMAVRLATLIGFIIIITDLGWTSLNIVETWLLWAMLSVALAFNLAFNATNTGTTSSVAHVDAAFCFRRRYLPTALASSITHFVIELYLLVRLFWVRVPRRARLRNRLLGSKVFAIARICSLITLDALTIASDVISIDIFGHFIPYSIGALVVLAVFNHKPPSMPSPLPSMVISSKPRRVSDLLAPTPFTLHFPPDDEQVDPHSWCSQSLHSPPASGQPSQVSTELAGGSVDLASMQGIENAVIVKASPAWRRSVRKLSLAIPLAQSAPATIGSFDDTPQHTKPRYPHKILQSQVQVAARLEREDSTKLKTPGPVKGLTVPPISQQESHGTIETEEDSSSSTGRSSTGRPGSTVYGSDIIQLTPSKRRADRAVHPFPSYPQSSIASPISRQSTRRHSFASSWFTDPSSDESIHDERSVTVTSPPTSRRHSFLSPDSGGPRSPRRTRNHYSLVFTHSRPRDDSLPTVREMSPDVGPPHEGGAAVSRSRRKTFAGSFSMRRAKKDAVTDLFVPHEPVPPLLAHLPANPPVRGTDAEELMSPPDLRLLPATPGSDVTASSGPASATSPRRALNGKVKGPRPLPSALFPGSGWPPQEQDVLSNLGRSASRRSSCPSLHSQESARAVVDRRRPSA